jgi:hypothetical protein
MTFQLVLTLRDKRHGHDFNLPISMAIELDQELRIAPRLVDEMKIGIGTFDGAVRLMRVREIRKRSFIAAATRLGALLAERMEDAEGWHDVERTEPARKQLGGDWE